MNVTKDVIIDLYPLYLEQECSADTRALVEEYLRKNPQQAEELSRAANDPIPARVPAIRDVQEVQALREARRRVRRRSWLLGLAIFFSLTPFSFIYTGGKTYFLCMQSPVSALIYGAAALVCWIVYRAMGTHSNDL